MASGPDLNGSAVPVVIAEDSFAQRRYLRAVLEAGTEFTVVGEARNGREAVAVVERLGPAALLLDLELPGMRGLEVIERIMAIRPTPIVVYSEDDTEHGAQAMDALSAGAVDVVPKPQLDSEAAAAASYAAELRRRLKVASRIKVITHPRARLRPGGAAMGRVISPRAAAARTAAAARAAMPRPSRGKDRAALTRTSHTELVAIGASTGGPQALASLLPALPADFAPAVLVVQHMADGFIPGLVAWLDGLCSLPVVMGQTGRRLAPGTVTIAPSGLNLLVLDNLKVVCEKAPARQFHVPGVDAAFLSVAEHVGPTAIGVILTGMGRDGATGLKAMRDAGATTLGQDEASSAVYGMPQAAFAAGAVEHQMPLADIAPSLLSLVEEADG